MRSVSQIKLYFGRWKIECTLIRPDKCKELRISFARNLEECQVGFVQGKEEEVVSRTKPLGTAWKLKFRGRFWTFYIQGMNFSSFQAMEPKNEPS